MHDSRSLSERVTAAPGTAQNPMSAEQVVAKCRDIVTPIMGSEGASRLIHLIGDLENLSSVRDLRPLLRSSRKVS